MGHGSVSTVPRSKSKESTLYSTALDPILLEATPSATKKIRIINPALRFPSQGNPGVEEEGPYHYRSNSVLPSNGPSHRTLVVDSNFICTPGATWVTKSEPRTSAAPRCPFLGASPRPPSYGKPQQRIKPRKPSHPETPSALRKPSPFPFQPGPPARDFRSKPRHGSTG